MQHAAARHLVWRSSFSFGRCSATAACCRGRPAAIAPCHALLYAASPWPPILLPAAAVRLVNGSNARSGRVEVYHDGVWGTVSWCLAAAAGWEIRTGRLPVKQEAEHGGDLRSGVWCRSMQEGAGLGPTRVPALPLSRPCPLHTGLRRQIRRRSRHGSVQAAGVWRVRRAAWRRSFWAGQRAHPDG